MRYVSNLKKKIKILRFFDNEAGRDVEMMLPLHYFAENILNWGVDFDTENTGSGDRTFDYVRLGFNIFLTIPTVIVWSVLDRNRRSYNRLSYWFQVVIRIALIFASLAFPSGEES